MTPEARELLRDEMRIDHTDRQMEREHVAHDMDPDLAFAQQMEDRVMDRKEVIEARARQVVQWYEGFTSDGSATAKGLPLMLCRYIEKLQAALPDEGRDDE